MVFRVDKEDSVNIAKLVEEGRYFDDAQNWYHIKYIKMLGYRSYGMIAAVAVLLIALTIAMNLKNVISVVQPLPFLARVADTTQDFPAIRPLSTKDESVQRSIARYLIVRYVSLREYYDPVVMADRARFKSIQNQIRSTSMQKVLKDYKHFMNRRNPYSPFVRYGKSTKRQVTVKKIDFIDEGQFSGKVNVYFVATEKRFQKETKTNWVAEVHYKLSDVYSSYFVGAPLSFVVSYYAVKKGE